MLERMPVKNPAWQLQCTDLHMVSLYNNLLHQWLTEQIFLFIPTDCLAQSPTHTSPRPNRPSMRQLTTVQSKLNSIAARSRQAVFHGVPRYQDTSTIFSTGKACKKDSWSTHWIFGALLPSKKGGLSHDLTNLHLPPEVIQWHIKSAYKMFNWIKKELLWCNTWIAGLINAKTAHTNTKKCTLWKQLWSTGKAQAMVWAVCGTLSDQWHAAELFTVFAPSLDGIGCQEFTSKSYLKGACIDKAGCHFTQASNTLFLTVPLLYLFWQNRI